MYCTVAEVKDAISYPSTGAPVSDTVISDFILDAQEEIEDLYHTKFGVIEISGTADGDYSTTTFSDSTQTFTANQYIGYVVWIYGGIGAGQYREIASNTTKKLTVSPAFTTTPDATSTYRITKLGYQYDLVDGSGRDTQFVIKQPLVNLNTLTVDSVDVTPDYVYQYKNSGKLIVGGTNCEVSVFSNNNPQLVDMKYIYGVYPFPRIIKRLCACISGIKTLISQIAGTYDDFTSVSLPAGFNASKGEPYMNIKSAVENLQSEAKGIVFGSGDTNVVSADYRKNPVYRPYTLFG